MLTQDSPALNSQCGQFIMVSCLHSLESGLCVRNKVQTTSLMEPTRGLGGVYMSHSNSDQTKGGELASICVSKLSNAQRSCFCIRISQVMTALMILRFIVYSLHATYS